MKLRDGFITEEVNDTQMMVATGDNAFHGIVRSNRTAAWIVDHLRTDTTREALVDAMADHFDAPRETIARDVDRILDTLREIGALEE